MDLIMGMNSGSSFDGIDVILAETEMAEDGFPKAPRFICGGSYEWPKEVAVCPECICQQSGYGWTESS